MPRYIRALAVAVPLACALGVLGAVPASAAGQDLHRGSHGPRVRVLEQRLHQLKLLPASAVDQRYRTATVRAVRKFQRQQRVKATGRVNLRTWTLVARAAAPRPAAKPVSTPPKPPAPPPPPPAPPVIIGHRGAVSSSAPENTLASMRNAAQSADVLEFDLQMTADHQFVLMHDRTLDRTTNCTGAVSARTLAALRSACTVSGQPIPTFDEVAKYAATTSAAIAPELKMEVLSDEELASVVTVLRAHGLTGRTFLQSFHEALFPRLRALEPRLTFVFLTKTPEEPATIKDFGATIAGVNLTGLTASAVTAYQRAGLRVWAYTALTTAELKTSWNLRVNGVFTDLPAEARAMFHPPA